MKKHISFLLALVLLTVTQSMLAQGTAFTYQGQLQNNGNPANGNYDFTFALYNTNATSGTQVGSTLTDLDVGVTNGLFTVTLDFGSVFTGNPAWLAIGVRTNGGSNLTALNPLQELTPTPYATYAPNSGTASNVTGSIALSQLPGAVVTNGEAGVNVTGTFSGNGGGLISLNAANLTGALPAISGANLASLPANVALLGANQTLTGQDSFSGNVGIGTTSLIARLNVDVGNGGGFSFPGALFQVENCGNACGQPAWTEAVRLWNQNGYGRVGLGLLCGTSGALTNTPTVYLGTGDYGSQSDFRIATGNGTGLTDRLYLNGTSGNVGIGTTTPASALDVAGNIHTSGTFSGNGSALTSLNAANLTGALPALNGASLTSLNASQLTSGTIPLAQLSSTVAFLNSNQTFTGQNSFSSNVGIGTTNPQANLQIYGTLIAGGTNNAVDSSSLLCAVACGDTNSIFESAWSFIGNGTGNSITNGQWSGIGGGYGNSIQADRGSVISGGESNTITDGVNATIGGGFRNQVTAYNATVPGGFKNVAAGLYSFAAGQNAQAMYQGDFVWADSAGGAFTSTANDQFLIRAAGGVGIGTTSPAATLDVAGGIHASGNVGIGVSSATHALLDVGGNVGSYNLTTPNREFTSSSGTALGNLSANGSATASVYAAGDIVTAGKFIATSDERVKNIEGRSAAGRDLATLMGIAVTDFRYKDVIAHGNGPQKKVIAQQVEKIFPQAVSKHTDAVPDIYQPAACKDGWVALVTDLKQGERVKLISGKAEGVYQVLEVAKDHFRTAFKPAGGKVFVFGREVKDFRAVDYDAIAILNVSATQELARRMEKLEARETHLAELEQKAAEVTDLKREVADLKKMVAQLAQSNRAIKDAAAKQDAFAAASLDH